MDHGQKTDPDLAAEIGWDADPVTGLQDDVGRLNERVRSLARAVADLRTETIDLRRRFENTVCDMSDLHRRTAQAFSQSTSQQVQANISLARNTMQARRPLSLFVLLAFVLFCVMTPPIFIMYRQTHDVARYATVFPVQGPFTVDQSARGLPEAAARVDQARPGEKIAWILRLGLRPDVTARATWRIVRRDSDREIDIIVRYASPDPSGREQTMTQIYAIPASASPGDYQVVGYVDIYPEGHGRVATPREHLTPIDFKIVN